MAYQVAGNFEPDHWDNEEKKLALARKRQRIEADCDNDMAKRQLAWMSRGSSKPGDQSWRPVALHRTKAKRVLQMCDNQIRVSTCLVGLAAFVYDATSPQWASWRLWPGLGWSVDNGSDNVCAWHAAAYKYDMNIWMNQCQQHMCARSFEQMLRDAGLWHRWLCDLVTLNLEFGPHRDELRRHQLRTGLARVYKNRRPDEVPYFMALAPTIAEELEEAGLVVFDRERRLEDEVWAWCAARVATGATGRRISMSRYGASLHAAKASLGVWTLRLFERTMLAIEGDMLKGKRMAKLQVKLTASEAPGDDSSGPTSAKRLNIEDKVVRDCCQSAVVVSVMGLNDYDHRSEVNMVVHLSKPLDDYATEVSRLRAVSEYEEFMKKMTCGGFTQLLMSFVAYLEDEATLSHCGFWLKGALPFADDDDAANLLMLQEDDAAFLYLQVILGFVRACGRRGLGQFHPWPFKMTRLLDAECQADTIEEFKHGEAIWDRFKSLAGKNGVENRVMARSLFQLRCVKQYQAAFEELGHVAHPDVVALARQGLRAILINQAVADLNGCQRSWGSRHVAVFGALRQ